MFCSYWVYRTQVRLVTTSVNLLGLVMLFTLDCRLPWLVHFDKTECHTSGIDRGKSFWLSTIVTGFKTKYMTMSRDQNAGRSHSMKIDNSSIERVGEFKYLGTKLTNKNSIQEEIKSRLKLGNASYYSVQNLLSSSLLSKKLKI